MIAEHTSDDVGDNAADSKAEHENKAGHGHRIHGFKKRNEN